MRELGEPIADLWTPRGVGYGEWSRFLGLSYVLIVLVLVGVFIWYRMSYHRRRHINSVDDVFQQAVPWYLSLLWIVVFHAAACQVLAIIALHRWSFDVVLSVLLLAIIEAVIGVAVYIIACFAATFFPRGMPPRARYVPLLTRGRSR
ncbi:hypothetical protein JXD38_05100 [candidate division WOR-3 bacterium]|nr:hypothetical protein [candidate division WOR-3 bacterium]